MNSIYHLCGFGINEGSVCRECISTFKPLSVNDTKFDKCIECESCDIYGFPCLQCAKDVFDYSLGSGNGYQNIDNENDKGDILDADQLLEILANINIDEIIEKTVDEIIEKTVDEIIIKKTTSYYSYCSIQ